MSDDKPTPPFAVWTGRVFWLCSMTAAVMLTIKLGLVLFT